MVTKEMLVVDHTTKATRNHNNNNESIELFNSIRNLESLSNNNEVFINRCFKAESDACCINMDPMNTNSSHESEPVDSSSTTSINQTIKIHTTSVSTTAALPPDNISSSSLIHKDTRFLKPDLNNLETVSLSELDNMKYQKKLSIYYKTKIKKLQNKFSHNKNQFMERLVNKNGQANINRINIASRRRKYISDLFNTIVDMSWSSILVIFLSSFIVSWSFFGVLWFVLVHLSDNICISNVDKTSTFFDSFVFSIETQQTIGYGYRYITENCRFSMLILMIQCAFSVLLESFLGGVIFAKLSRPKKRTETLVFSKQAMIAPRDGIYNLMVRVGDLRKSHIILAHVKMYLIRSRFTSEGEYIPCEILELPVMSLNNTDLLLFMPIIVAHKIDQTSPLYEMIAFKNKYDSNSYAEEFLINDFEILVTLEGTVESTGASTQARTSFLPSEIVWNHVFEPLISVSENNSKATIDFSLFNNTIKMEDLKQEPKSKRAFSIFNNVCLKRNSNDENNNNTNKIKTKKLSVPFISLNNTFNKKDSNFQLV